MRLDIYFLSKYHYIMFLYAFINLTRASICVVTSTTIDDVFANDTLMNQIYRLGCQALRFDFVVSLIYKNEDSTEEGLLYIYIFSAYRY